MLWLKKHLRNFWQKLLIILSSSVYSSSRVAYTKRSSLTTDWGCLFFRILLMEEPWTWLLVCPGALQRPEWVWKAAGDNADPDTGQLHGGHQLWVLVWRPPLQREEADSLCGLHADERALFQLTTQLPNCTVMMPQTDLTDLTDLTYCQHSGMIQAWQDAAYFKHRWHFYKWTRGRKALRGGKKKHYSGTQSLHIDSETSLLQNNGVTFTVIWSLSAGVVKYPCYSTSPENLLPGFLWVYRIVWVYVSLFSSICSRCWKGTVPYEHGQARVGKSWLLVFWESYQKKKTSCHFDWSNMIWKTTLSPFYDRLGNFIEIFIRKMRWVISTSLIAVGVLRDLSWSQTLCNELVKNWIRIFSATCILMFLLSIVQKRDTKEKKTLLWAETHQCSCQRLSVTAFLVAGCWYPQVL